MVSTLGGGKPKTTIPVEELLSNMDEKFRKLPSRVKATLMKHLDSQELRSVFSLTEDEAQLGKELAESEATPPQRTDLDAAFREFLKNEYSNIATAHFNAGTTITHFFQFYLLIIGVPITVAGVVEKLGASAASATTSPSSAGFRGLLADPLVAVVSFAVALVGFFMMAFLVNLRLEALLYARTVNGVRKVFYEKAGLGAREELAIRVLPRSTSKPRYWEPRYFGWIVASFATLNGLYFALAVWNLAENKFTLVHAFTALLGNFAALLSPLAEIARLATLPGLPTFLGLTTFLLSFPLHFGVYRYLARYHELRYLRTHRIGLDIDGVLGDHRTAFCRILPTAVPGKTLDAETITRIPLHECPDLRDADGNATSISRQHEHAVFNTAAYWTNMPVYEDAADVIRELKDALHFEIFVFTYRPWPNPAAFCGTMPREASGWRDGHPLNWLATKIPIDERSGPIRIVPNWFLEKSRRWSMTRITKRWLGANRISHDHLVVEQGNIHVADPRSKGKNRFRLSDEKEIRMFVEDDLIKARKLANVCEWVYLIDQPYNRANDLPSNMIRVQNWPEIKQHIRDNL